MIILRISKLEIRIQVNFVFLTFFLNQKMFEVI